MDLSMLDGVEKQLAEWYKNAPNLPKGFKDWLAKYIWIFALVGGIFMTLSALALLSALGIFSFYASYYGAAGYAFFGWLSLIAVIAVTVMTFMAVTPLKEQKERGWKLMFILEFFYMVYGVLQWLYHPAYFGNLLGTFLGAAIGFYFLFQIKEYFK